MHSFKLTANYVKTAHPEHPFAYKDANGNPVINIVWEDTFHVNKHFFAFGQIMVITADEYALTFHYSTGYSSSLMVTLASADSASVVVFNEEYQKDAPALYQRAINAIGNHFSWPADLTEEFKNKLLSVDTPEVI